MPRAPPPPPPPPKEALTYDNEYDPYNYNAAAPAAPAVAAPSAPAPSIPVAPSFPPPPPTSQPPAPAAPVTQAKQEEVYYHQEPQSYAVPQQVPRSPPPPPPSSRGRQSVDIQRSGFGHGHGRRSIDVARPSTSMDSGYVANDLDLASHTGWWLQPNGLPPQLHGRKDIFSESEESTSTDHGKTVITRDIYILYQDYSQTIITVRFNPHDQSDVQLEQRHEAPPRPPRQDQLEQAYDRFGRTIADAAAARKDTVVGDGTPHALIYDLLRPLRDALLPVGNRAYGALVYANLANASTLQNDEIRPGDILSIRNAKFQGKHGAMHAKYSMEVGKPDGHVAIVAEWDGTKKKVRAWEQGREGGSKKVKMESYKLDDLRSGEVKIWRVMPRSWIGWEGAAPGSGN